VIVRFIAADKMPRNFYENRNRRLMLCSRNATKSSAEAVSLQHSLYLVQHEFAGKKPWIAHEMAFRQDGSGRQIEVPAFLRRMSATRLVRRLKPGRRVDAALVADLSLTQKIQLIIETAMKPALQKEIFSGARGSYLLFLCWLVLSIKTSMRKAIVMLIYMFTSEASPNLYAFAGDTSGSKLPESHRSVDCGGFDQVRPTSPTPIFPSEDRAGHQAFWFSALATEIRYGDMRGRHSPFRS
jgi:hypothetical protein